MRNALLWVLATVLTTAMAAAKAAAIAGAPLADGARSAISVADVVTARLALMPEVAKIKWNRGLPVEDLERERALIARLLADVAEPRRTQVARAIRGQIAASKHIQRTLFERWTEAGLGEFTDVRELEGDLRPAITELTTALIHALSLSCDTTPSRAFTVVREFPEAYRIAIDAVGCNGD